MKNGSNNRIVLPACLLLLCLLFCGCARQTVPAEISPEPAAEDYSGRLRISELMVKNRATLPDEDGAFRDWVELENISGDALELSGWQLADSAAGSGWILPERRLAAGELLLIFCGRGGSGADFSLAPGETLRLLAPDGSTVDRVLCEETEADQSLVRQPDGSFRTTAWVSPGSSNDSEGYAAFCASRADSFPLQISEVMTANAGVRLPGVDEYVFCDWVEIQNVSDQSVDLSQYRLSDDPEQPDKWRFPEESLAPGAFWLVYCTDDADAISYAYAGHRAGFSLDAQYEQLYLTDAEGALLDYAALRELPLDGSMGRMEGENGFFYFAQATPGSANLGGRRRVSAQPLTVEPDGVFNNVESVTVELQAPGQIRYTLDGTLPDGDSPVYSGPLTLDHTCVLRCAALEEDAMWSPIASYSYIINENHSLPVLSLTVDDSQRFFTYYNAGWKDPEVPAKLSLYDGEHSFRQTCGLSMKGWTSLALEKKSMGVNFRGRYGGDLHCDVFGNGIEVYSSLDLRAGQDYPYAIIRNELFQNLCLEASQHCLTQESKYCILYLNGAYYGIYCLKEDFSRQYYASHAHVSKESVTVLKTPVSASSDFYRDVLEFAWNHNMRQSENYDLLSQRVDMDSLIDWFLLEAYCANTDIQGNVRLFRSPENGGRWVFGFYDLDWGFYYPEANVANLMVPGFGNCGYQLPPLIQVLARNDEFRRQVLSRFSQLIGTTLSNEHVLSNIDRMEQELDQEADRDRDRWDLPRDRWHHRVEELRRFLTKRDYAQFFLDNMCQYFHVSQEERTQYFGDR